MVAVVQMVLALEAGARHLDGNICDRIRFHRGLRGEGADQVYARRWCSCPFTLQNQSPLCVTESSGSFALKQIAAQAELHLSYLQSTPEAAGEARNVLCAHLSGRHGLKCRAQQVNSFSCACQM